MAYGDDFMKADEELWNGAVKKAIEFTSNSEGSRSKKKSAGCDVKLPQLICSYCDDYEVQATSYAVPIGTPTVNLVKSIHSGHLPTDSQDEDNNNSSTQSNSSTSPSAEPPQCKDGSRIFHLVPARLDLTLASAQVYALAAALYLDRRLSRHTTEKISLICDVRGGDGWANPTPWSLLPFIRATSSLLGHHFPERLKRFVLFPMPSSAVWIWSAAKKFVDVDTASKVVVVGLVGASGNANDCINDELDEFITKKDLGILEERRRTFFTRKNE